MRGEVPTGRGSFYGHKTPGPLSHFSASHFLVQCGWPTRTFPKRFSSSHTSVRFSSCRKHQLGFALGCQAATYTEILCAADRDMRFGAPSGAAYVRVFASRHFLFLLYSTPLALPYIFPLIHHSNPLNPSNLLLAPFLPFFDLVPSPPAATCSSDYSLRCPRTFSMDYRPLDVSLSIFSLGM